MSRKDYEAIAAIIKSERDTPCSDADSPVIEYVTDSIAMQLVNLFSADNPRFDKDRFLSACGVLFEDRYLGDHATLTGMYDRDF